jgi:hypothetical protein
MIQDGYRYLENRDTFRRRPASVSIPVGRILERPNSIYKTKYRGARDRL